MSDEFNTGKKRRAIEDDIMERFRTVDFRQSKHRYLEDEDFWDFVFSWYDLVRYYEQSQDTAIGAHMLELFKQCRVKFGQAATDDALKERRRDKAADAIRQMTYYVDRMLKQAERNGIQNANRENDEIGNIDWAASDDDADAGSPPFSPN